MSDLNQDPVFLPDTKVIEYKKGIDNIQRACDEGLYNLKDESGEDSVENVLFLNKIPRYFCGDIETMDNTYSPALGDIFSSILFISKKLESLEKEIVQVKRRQELLSTKNTDNEEEIEHMRQHVSAAEENLRSLRDTLCYGDLDESDLPPVKEECSYIKNRS